MTYVRTALLTLGAMIGIASRRLWVNRRIVAGMLAGFTAAVAASASVPAFTAGALQRVLQTELAGVQAQMPGRQPAGVQIAHFEKPKHPTKAADYERADKIAQADGPALIGLPVQPLVRYATLELTPAVPVDKTKLNPDVQRWSQLAFLSDLAAHTRLVDGRLPTAKAAAGSYEAMVEEDALDKLDLTVGAQLKVPLSNKADATEVQVTIVGVFARANATDPYWFLTTPLEQQLFVPEETFRTRLLTDKTAVPGQYSWYYGIANDQVKMPDVIRLLSGLYQLEARMGQPLPDTELFQGPMELLTRYAYKAQGLQLLLLLLAIPALAATAYFLVVTSGLMVDTQRQEIAVLRSRGASVWQVASIYVVEGLLLAGAAMGAGYPLAILLARAMGAAVGFLQFVDRPQPPLLLPADFWLYGLGAALLAVLAYMLPAIPAARQSIVSYKQEAARGLRRPLWTRLGLDVICLGLASYAYYTLTQRHAVLVSQATVDGGSPVPVMEPLHILAPALFVFGAGLLLLRFLPLLWRLVARLADRWAGVSLHLTLVQLARAATSYTPVVLLLCLTVGMGLYSASAARTLEKNTTDRLLYRSGADVIIDEAWELTDTSGSRDPAQQKLEVTAAPPWQGHYQLPGVVHPARVRLQDVTPVVQGRNQRKGKLMAIDSDDFAQVAWFRRDLTVAHPIAYLNLLAQDEEGVLVSSDFLRRNKLKPGDRVTVQNDQQQEVSLVIMGAVDYWPTLYPQEGDFFIANLDFVESNLGLKPYAVWLKMQDGAKLQPALDDLKAQKITVVRADDNRAKLVKLRRDPQLGGLLGGLTSGFLLAALVTVLGFWLHAALSARSRLLSFGVLRAMGLSAAQLLTAVALEQVLTVLTGVAAGTGLGVVAAKLFVPFLQQGADAQSQTPPFVVVDAAADRWRLYIVLLLMLTAGLGGLMLALSRLRIHEAVKLGEDT